MSRILSAAMAVAVLLVGSIAMSDSALAHERRQVGPYQLVVGFLSEPAFVDTANGVDLRVTDTRSTPPTPVEGLQETVSVEVFHAGLTRSLSLKFSARFGMPGAYAAHFIPTKSGNFRFHITGKIGDQQVNENFESGPGRFDEVRAVTALQYPEPVPAGADLTERIASLERELGSARAFAVIALLFATVFPLAMAARARRRGR